MSLIESSRTGAMEESVASPFRTAGAAATGEFRCAECGYGIAVRSLLPICPMCHGLAWDEPSSTPFGLPRL